MPSPPLQAAIEVQAFRVTRGAPCPFVRILANVGEPDDDPTKPEDMLSLLG